MKSTVPARTFRAIAFVLAGLAAGCGSEVSICTDPDPGEPPSCELCNNNRDDDFDGDIDCDDGDCRGSGACDDDRDAAASDTSTSTTVPAP